MSSVGFAVSLDDVGTMALLIGYEAARLRTYPGGHLAGFTFTGDRAADIRARSILTDAFLYTRGAGIVLADDADDAARAAQNYQATEAHLQSLRSIDTAARLSADPAAELARGDSKEVGDSAQLAAHGLPTFPALPQPLLFQGDPAFGQEACASLLRQADLVKEVSTRCDRTARSLPLISWSGTARDIFMISVSAHVKSARTLAGELARLADAFENLATGLYSANRAGFDAQYRAAAWGINIDSTAAITGVNSQLGAAFVAAPYLGPVGHLVPELDLMYELVRMKMANRIAGRARQIFVDTIDRFSFSEP